MRTYALFGILLPFNKPNKVKLDDLLKKIYEQHRTPFPAQYVGKTSSHKYIGKYQLLGIDSELELSRFFYGTPYYYISIKGTFKNWWAVECLEDPDVSPQTSAKIKDILKGLGFVKECDKKLNWFVLARTN